MQAELARMRELAQADARAEKLLSLDVKRLLQDVLAHVIDSFPVQAEHVRLVIRSFDEQLQVGTQKFGELLEDEASFLLSQVAHRRTISRAMQNAGSAVKNMKQNVGASQSSRPSRLRDIRGLHKSGVAEKYQFSFSWPSLRSPFSPEY